MRLNSNANLNGEMNATLNRDADALAADNSDNGPASPGFTPNTEGVFFDLPAGVYHKAPGISQSRLKEFDEYATPLHYKNRKPKETTADMEFGTICHTAILQPEMLKDAYYIRPATYTAEVKKQIVQKKWTGNSDWCSNWLHEHSDRPVITKEKEATIEKIVNRACALDVFGAALGSGQKEVSHFKRDPLTGLLLKCRLDLVATEYNGITWIFDLKKVQSGGAAHGSFQKSIEDYGYHIQAASYLEITGASHFVFVAFDDDEPFDTALWELDPESLQLGLSEYRRILNRFAECVESDCWTGYQGGIHPIGLSHWAKKRLTQGME